MPVRDECGGRELENTNTRGRYLTIIDAAADTIIVVDRRGAVQRFTGVMREVAARDMRDHQLREATASTRAALTQAATAGRAKAEFLAVMSHEMRTPLTSASGFIDLLAHTADLTREQRRYIELVGTANGALLTVIDDILDFSKIESGQLKLERRAFSPRAIVNDTLAIVRPLAAAKGLQLDFALHGDVPDSVMGDQARLRQILLNLLNNAVKFTESGSIAVDVRPEHSADGRERTRFSVADSGIGISVADRQRVFESFSQADSSLSRRHGGIGLGLSICRRLVELMDGEMGIISDGHRGSTFWFTACLPLPRESKPNATIGSRLPDATKRKARILVVDDIDVNREIVEAFLSLGGYDVDTAAGGGEAIRMLQAERYDLVLMDIQMPEMDGMTATQRIRCLPDSIKDIPIIAMTGNVMPAQVQSFLKAGMNGHIGKPIERTKLYDKIQRWLPKADTLEIDVAALPIRAAIAQAVASVPADVR
jgi:signal transduction histidine kinase/FixJ family two-component response regulator